MEYGMAFFFRIANQPVVKFICPDTGEMLVHQMLADADIQGAHQHILLLAYLFKTRWKCCSFSRRDCIISVISVMVV